MSELAARFAHERTRQPPIAAGTPRRFRWLFDHARADLSLARLLEADADALAIATDLGVDLVNPGAAYGVWAAAGGTVVSRTDPTGGTVLDGCQPWAGGAALVDRALVLVRGSDGLALCDVAVPHHSIDLSGWQAEALRETTTGSVVFSATPARWLSDGAAYFDRAGFWHGAIGVAACWAGAAAGLLDAHLQVWRRRDPHALAHLGAAVAEADATRAILMCTATEVDAAVDESVAMAEMRARSVRYVVDAACRRLIDHLSVGAGPYPLAMDGEVSRRTSELALTIRQCHGLREVESVGDCAAAGGPTPPIISPRHTC